MLNPNRGDALNGRPSSTMPAKPCGTLSPGTSHAATHCNSATGYPGSKRQSIRTRQLQPVRIHRATNLVIVIPLERVQLGKERGSCFHEPP